MDTAGPARLYCTLVGAVLVIAGIIGFFYSAGFDTGVNGVAADTDEVFGILAVNGWHNLFHIALGLLALAVAGSTSGARTYCLGRRPPLPGPGHLGLRRLRQRHPRPDPAQQRGQLPVPDPRAHRPRRRRGDARRPAARRATG